MKKILVGVVVGLSVVVLPSFASMGKQLFQSKGCSACHNPNLDTTGPALKKIAAKYRGNEENLIKFLRGKAAPKVEPHKFTIMKPQLNDTKKLSNEELKELVKFIIGH
jgi:cytochrome c